MSDVKIAVVTAPEEWAIYHRIKKEQIFDRHHHLVYDKNHPSHSSADNFHFMLCVKNHIVTIAHVELLDAKTAALRALATDGPDKRKGYAKQMMQWLENWVRTQNRTTLKLHAHLSAEYFYRRLNYVDMPFDDPSLSMDIVNLGKILSE